MIINKKKKKKERKENLQNSENQRKGKERQVLRPCLRTKKKKTPKEGRRTYRPKGCGNNNKDVGNSSKTLNDKNELRFRNLDK